MNRKEQIEHAAIEYIARLFPGWIVGNNDENYPKEAIRAKYDFIKGIEWSDEHPTEEVQRLKRMFESAPDAYEQGKKDAFKMAYKWLIERYDNQGVILLDDIRELYEKMEE